MMFVRTVSFVQYHKICVHIIMSVHIHVPEAIVLIAIVTGIRLLQSNISEKQRSIIFHMDESERINLSE